MSELPNFIIDRTFNAPPNKVWRAWTEPDLLARWYGPNVETIIHEFNLRPGGIWKNEMSMGDFSDLSISTFIEVLPEKQLIWHQSSADSDWNITANPMMPDWPRTVVTNVSFTDRGDQTDVRLVWTPHEASDAELACFNEAVSNFSGGWETGFSIMDDVLAEIAN
ncbi:MAG: SRPBCC domain-containing protein [Pseudomonadota bacterium]